MAKFLDYEGLGRYTELIKSLIKSGDASIMAALEEVRDLIGGSDDMSVAEKLADLKELVDSKVKELEDAHNADTEGLDERLAVVESLLEGSDPVDDRIENAVKSAIDAVVDGAPEAFDTLKEIASWIASDESGTADLISEVAANRAAIETNKAAIDADIDALSQHIDGAAEAFKSHDERLDMIEDLIGIGEDSDDNLSLTERVENLEDTSHDEPGVITDAEIALLFIGGGDSTETVKYASDATSVKSISAAQAKESDLIVTSDEAVNALTENKTYKNIAIGSNDIETKLTLKAVESIAIDGANINGRGEDATGNGSVNFTAKEMTVQNVNISGNTNYNVFEGTQDLTDKSAHIENLDVNNIVVEDPSIKHNIVNVYTPATGAKIMISDSRFVLNADNSNVLRMANYLNSENVEITFKNCDWTYVGGDMKWAGLMIYQPASADTALKGDYSHLATWKIKFVNCRYNGDLVTENVLGDHQAMYVYNMNGDGAVVGGAEAISMVGWKVSFE